MDFRDILRKWIEEYCKRHQYIIMEIHYKQRLVFYYLEGQICLKIIQNSTIQR